MNAYPLGLAAIQATISIYEKGNGAIYKQVDKVQRRLMDGMKETAKRHNFPMYIQGPTGVFVALFTDKQEINNATDLLTQDFKRQGKFINTMLADEGILTTVGGRYYVSAALTEKDVDKTLEIMDSVMGKI
jgi:glutamate-1-semialdehyde 2,1-aminomutase